MDQCQQTLFNLAKASSSKKPDVTTSSTRLRSRQPSASRQSSLLPQLLRSPARVARSNVRPDQRPPQPKQALLQAHRNEQLRRRRAAFAVTRVGAPLVTVGTNGVVNASQLAAQARRARYLLHAALVFEHGPYLGDLADLLYDLEAAATNADSQC